MPAKPRVTVTWYDDEEPAVRVEPVGSVEIAIVDGTEQNDLFLTHQGVSIYRTHKGSTHTTNWFAVRDRVDVDEPDAFDVRDLAHTIFHHEDLEAKRDKLLAGVDWGSVDGCSPQDVEHERKITFQIAIEEGWIDAEAGLTEKYYEAALGVE